jgi:predicted membrane protein
MKKRNHNTHNAGRSLGIFLIMMGIMSAVVIFDLFRLGEADDYFKWQILLIFIGLLSLFNNSGLGGVAMITTGTWFLLPETNLNLPDLFFTLYWPAAFIVAGIVVMAGGIFSKNRQKTDKSILNS